MHRFGQHLSRRDASGWPIPRYDTTRLLRCVLHTTCAHSVSQKGTGGDAFGALSFWKGRKQTPQWINVHGSYTSSIRNALEVVQSPE